MLDGARDTNGDIQLWCNDFAGLANLHIVWYETGVDSGTRSTDSSAEFVGQRVQVFEVVTVLHTTTAGNDDFGSGQFRTVGLGQLFAHEGRLASVSRAAYRFNSSGTAFSSYRVETGGTHGDHFHGSRRLHGSDGVTGIDRTLEGVGAFYRNDLGDLVNVQGSGNARQDVFAVRGSASQDVAVALAQVSNQRRNVFWQLVSVSSVVSQQYFRHTSDFACGFSGGSGVGASYQHVNVTTDFCGRSHSVQGGRRQSCVGVFSDN